MKFVELLHISIIFLRPRTFQCIKKVILSPQEIISRIGKPNIRRSLLDSGTKDFSIPKLGALTTDASLSKEAIAKASPLDELKETMKLVDDSRRTPAEGDSERTKTRDHDSRGRDSGYDGRGPRDREREKDIERRHSGKDKGSGAKIKVHFLV
ncbi:hypothetical protein BHM03_00032202 [Ensete ventricosum]|nr:hypothetical protein BHM03_00032202 [Ensete ventricosum]